MFDRPVVGFLHLIVYVAFLLINIELLEIIIDGVSGKHRSLAPYLGSFYNFLIAFFEILALLVIISVILFWIRRNIIKIERFIKNDLKGWPKLDANMILYIEIILMFLFLNMNATDQILQNENFNNYFEKGLPNKRNEDWKFSDINQIISKNFDNLNFIVDQKKVFEEKDFPLDFEHNKISFVDGKLYDFDFKHEDKDKILVDENLDLDDTIYQNTLLNLNSAFLTSVSKITIQKGYNVKKPLILFNYLSDGLKSSAINSDRKSVV